MRTTLVVLAITCDVAAAGKATTIELPVGKSSIEMSDVSYSPRLKKLLIPGGHTGKLFLVDPISHRITSIGGFPTSGVLDITYLGVISAADTGTALALADVATDSIWLVTDKTRATIKADDTPYSVRWVAATKELWVVERDKQQIEVFSVSPLKSIAKIAVDGTREIAIDHVHGRAFTNGNGGTVAIDLKTRAVGKAWPNGCTSPSAGIAVDEAHDLVFVGCVLGDVVALDAKDGHVISKVSAVELLGTVAYSPTKRHVYVAGAESGDSAVIGVSAKGELAVLGKGDGAGDSSTIVTDDAGHAFVCGLGALIVVDDRW